MQLGSSFRWCAPRRVIAAAPEIIQRCDENSIIDSVVDFCSHGADSCVSYNARGAKPYQWGPQFLTPQLKMKEQCLAPLTLYRWHTPARPGEFGRHLLLILDDWWKTTSLEGIKWWLCRSEAPTLSVCSAPAGVDHGELDVGILRGYSFRAGASNRCKNKPKNSRPMHSQGRPIRGAVLDRRQSGIRNDVHPKMEIVEMSRHGWEFKVGITWSYFCPEGTMFYELDYLWLCNSTLYLSPTIRVSQAPNASINHAN